MDNKPIITTVNKLLHLLHSPLLVESLSWSYCTVCTNPNCSRNSKLCLIGTQRKWIIWYDLQISGWLLHEKSHVNLPTFTAALILFRTVTLYCEETKDILRRNYSVCSQVSQKYEIFMELLHISVLELLLPTKSLISNEIYMHECKSCSQILCNCFKSKPFFSNQPPFFLIFVSKTAALTSFFEMMGLF